MSKITYEAHCGPRCHDASDEIHEFSTDQSAEPAGSHPNTFSTKRKSQAKRIYPRLREQRTTEDFFSSQEKDGSWNASENRSLLSHMIHIPISSPAALLLHTSFSYIATNDGSNFNANAALCQVGFRADADENEINWILPSTSVCHIVNSCEQSQKAIVRWVSPQLHRAIQHTS